MANYQLEPPATKDRGDIIAGDPAQRARDRIWLGTVVETGPRKKVYLDVTGEQVVALLGKRGTGKSYTLGVLLEGLGAGAGASPVAMLETPRSGLVLDIMDIFWTSQIPLVPTGSPEIVRQYERMASKGLKSQQLAIDVWLPDGYQNGEIDPEGVNVFRMQASDLELDDWAALFEVDIFGEPRGMLIADVVSHVSTEGYTRSDNARVAPKHLFGFSDLLACLDSDADIAQNYRSDSIRSVRQRLSSYGALPLFAGQGTPLVDLLKPFRVGVLMLARLPDALKKVIVAVLLKRIMRNRRDASFAQKRIDLDAALSKTEKQRLEAFVAQSIPRTWVLLDEAHVLAGTDEGSVARDALVKYAKEGRNYGLSLAVATQQPSALDLRLTSQAETLVVHQLTSPSDAAVATQNTRSPPPENIRVDGVGATMETVFRRLGQGEALFSCGNAPHLLRPCVVGIRPRISAHGGYEA